MWVPLLTEADKVTSSEGPIDPLGLFQTADALAERLVPDVRERQAHPRFLTAIAVSLAVCGEFGEEAVARDDASEPWQVFEWYAVEGLVRTCDPSQIVGLPGRDKTDTAIGKGVPLSARSYLKTPSVFGFHGVYRVLTRALEVETAGHLGHAGFDLLTAWMHDQGLRGFYDPAAGIGSDLHRQLVAAIKDGLDQGCVARRGGWQGWKFFGKHLGLYSMGPAERKVLRGAMLDPSGGYRRDVLAFLASAEGSQVWRRTKGSERAFHHALASKASRELKVLLSAISRYEFFGRLIQDAFDDCLAEMTRRRGRTKMRALAELDSVKRAASQVPFAYARAAEALQAEGQEASFSDLFGQLADRLPPIDWVERLLEHHCRVQRDKPPSGKASWYERCDNGDCVVRGVGRRETGGSDGKEYVRPYRTGTLWSFARDLRMVR